jgi:hypothetical protein
MGSWDEGAALPPSLNDAPHWKAPRVYGRLYACQFELFGLTFVFLKMPANRSNSARARLARLKRGLPRHKIAQRSGGSVLKNPFFARAGGSAMGGPLPGGRATRGVTMMVVGALLLVCGRWYFGQRVNLGGQIERVLRSQFIPQLEKQLGAKVEVGSIQTDLLGRVVVNDIVIGRDGNLPTGALARATRVTISLDLPGLVLRRAGAVESIRSVVLDQPQVYLRRDKTGLNWAKMFKGDKKGPKIEWTGRVSVIDGRVYYLDTAVPSASGAPLLVDARGVDATVDALVGAPYSFKARSRQPLFGARQTRLNEISSQGSIDSDFKHGLAGMSATALPLPLVGDFAFPRKDVIVRGGLASGNVQISLGDAGISPHGSLVVTGGAVTVNSFLEPNSTRPLRVDALTGPMQFVGTALSTSGASLRTLDANFTVAGAAALGNTAPQTPVFDLDVATRALPLARLQSFLPATIRQTNFSSGPTSLNAHLSGTSSRISATGALDAPGARIVDTKKGLRASFSALHTVFAAATSNEPGKKNTPLSWRFASRISAPSGSVNTPQGQLEARNWVATARGVSNGGLDVDVATANFGARTARYGNSRGAALHLVASTPSLANADWRGTANLQNAGTAGLNLAALSPQVARLVRKSGQLTVAANFSGLDNSFSTSRLKTDAVFSLSGLELNDRAFANNGTLPLQSEDFALSAIRGRLALQNGSLQVSRASAVSSFGTLRLDALVPLRTPNLARVALSIPTVEISAARFAPFLRAQNVSLDGAWRGRVSVLSGAAQNGKVGLDFDLRSTASQLRGLGNRGARVLMTQPRLQGRADFNSANPASSWSGGATITASEARLQSGTLGRFASLPANLSGARAVGLRLNLMAKAQPSGSRQLSRTALDWSGDVSSRRISAPLPLVGRSSSFVTIANVAAHLEPAAAGVEVSRFTAGFGDGRLEGTASVIGGKVTAQLLAHEIDAASVQRLVSPASLASARLSGTANATLQLVPGAPGRVHLRLTDGAIALPGASGTAVIPLDGARVNAILEPTGTIQLRDTLLWSEGARLSGQATLAPTRWSGKVEASGLRMERLATLPFARSLDGVAGPDGLADGQFTFEVDPKRPSEGTISGQTSLKLANIMGADIDSATAHIEARNGIGGWRLALTDLKGEAENAPFSGELSADLAANNWQLKLATKNLDTSRLTRLGALHNSPGSATRDDILDRTLPVNGSLAADIELAGTLRRADGSFAIRPNNGFARLSSGPIAYRGRPIGTVQADIDIDGGIARAKTLTLSRFAGPTGQITPLVTVTGELPLEINSPNLNAQVTVARAPLAFFTELLHQSSDALQQSDISAPFFERAVSYVDQLPDGTTGNVALEASLQGAWNKPRVHVTNLTLRDGRTRVPSGGTSPPATLDAAFTFENNAIAIEKAEFRLKKTPVQTSPTSPATPEGAAPAEDTEDDDTLLRIEPGGSAQPDGPIEISADVFNANLSQLSTWVPALRGPDGGPLLRGQLSEFSFNVGGSTNNPHIIGSIQAEALAFSSYTLDRLRVSRFQIGGGAARIEAGNLTLVRGAFQSSSAYGTVPWSWSPPGPVMNAPIDLHFPLQTRDFGALVGVAVPSLTVADADEFAGSVDVTGTLAAPELAGFITIRGGQFRLDPRQDAFQTGITNLSGTIRFVGGNQVIIDADDPLKGRLVSASAVVGRIARREEPRGEAPTRAAIAAGGPDPKGGKKESFQAPKLAGDWVLRGGITREVTVDTSTLLSPATALAQLRYDLNFSLDNGLYSSNQFTGVTDVSLGAVWKTGAGETPENAQNVRWMLAARGTKPRNLKNGGQLTSFGSVTLRPDFGTGIDALGHSRANDFAGEADFAALPVFKRIDFKKAPDRRAQLLLDKFATGLTGAGSGVLDGRLVLDNRPRVQQAPTEAIRLQNAALTGRGVRSSLFGRSYNDGGFSPLPRPQVRNINEEEEEEPIPTLRAQVPAPVPDRPRRRPAQQAILDSTPLRLGGTLTLDNAEIYGAPAGGEGVALLLSRLPSAPIFDVKLQMGRDVEIVTAAFRAGLQGYIVASGSPDDPQILGTLETQDGQVRFPNARARVEEGRVTIAINRDPETDGLRTRVEIDATARGTAGRYAITLRLRGPLDMGSNSTQNLRIDVSSNPPLSQNEAFQQLLGTVPNSEGSTNQAYASSVLSVLSAPLFSGVEQTLAQTLGLSSVGLEYRFNEPLAVQVTKEIGDRVIVSYRRSIGNNSSSASGRTPFELRLEYRLKGNYTIGLETDERRIPAITVQRSRQF